MDSEGCRREYKYAVENNIPITYYITCSKDGKK
jgi:hypothetical protein